MNSKATLNDLRRWRESETGEIAAVPAEGPRVAFVYPNSYAVGMSSLGYQQTLSLMRENGLAAERFFALTPPRSVESETPIHKFDIIAFSVSFELDWLHVLQFMQSAKIPLRASERNSRHPLILIGGVCVAVNRAPMWPFADVFLHGESEAIIPRLADALRQRDADRKALLEELQSVPGVEIAPGCARAYGLDSIYHDESILPEAPQWEIIEELGHTPCHSRILSPHAEFEEMGLIDLARGCPRHCTFCWIGHNAPPYRVAPIESIRQAAEFILRHTDRIGLVASAVAAHPQIDEIVTDLTGRGARISYSSLRAEEVTPAMLKALADSGQKSFTIAPEAASQRVRCLLGKDLPDERLFEVLDWALGNGMLSIKLYFMTGIPSETEEEADEIIRLVEQVRERMLKAGKKSGALGTIAINLGAFTPKPNLPLLKVPNHIDHQTLTRRLKRLTRALKKIPNTRVTSSSPDLAQAQGILSIGGPESAEFLLNVLRNNNDWRRSVRAWRKSHRSESFE